jgi:flagellar hook-length control protein FliK
VGFTPSQQAPLLSAGVGMHEAIENIRATIEIATRQGITQARIALQPEELGELRIHLTQSSEGLLARVMADTPDAAAALASAHSELRQSLNSIGVSLLRLDIGSFSQSDAQAHQERHTEAPGGSGGQESSNSTAEREEPETNRALTNTPTPSVLSRGGHIDVLA